MRVLEPSCGDGQLAAAVAKVMGQLGVIDCIDIDPVALQKAHKRMVALGRAHDTFTLVDFLTSHRDERIFDAVVMNPPFTRTASRSSSRPGPSATAAPTSRPC